MLDWIVAFAINHDVLIYLLIILVAFFQGPLLAVVFGIMLSLGHLHLLPIYAALMVGDLVGDTIWYNVGRRWGLPFVRRWGKYVSIDDASVERMTRVFHRYQSSVLFVSKITNGFGLAILTLFTAGMVRVPFGKYLLVNLLGQFLWTGFLLAAGYYSSSAFIIVEDWGGRMTIAAGITVLIFVAYRYARYLRDRAISYQPKDTSQDIRP